MTSPANRYMYHSFPRRAATAEETGHKGLAILQGLVTRGLLLVPEQVTWHEYNTDGTIKNTVGAWQQRACFTELAPAELNEHAATFGAFALEFDIPTLRRLGATPVFYLPQTTGTDGMAATPMCQGSCRVGKVA